MLLLDSVDSMFKCASKFCYRCSASKGIIIIFVDNESFLNEDFSWFGSSSADSDSDSSQGGLKGKRKRKTREKMEHFVEKLVGSMMKRQEKMHNQLINVMEKMKHERILSELGSLEAARNREDETERRGTDARDVMQLVYHLFHQKRYR